ncbi:MAG: hypothetical protein K6F20_01000 [Bacteroidaceae bacterium]|nr:hypothetical protein [Bacteroidaceae bacterium]
MSSLISRAIDNKVEVSKSLGQERDIQKEGTPLKWRCDIITFTLPKKQRSLLDEMIKAFEENGHNNPNCYGINTLTTGNPQNEGRRKLMIGNDINRYVTIGEQYGNYVNVNILDATDTTKTHRYAYALEWKEDRKHNTFVRYIVTYAKIPLATTTITKPSWPFDLGSSRNQKTGPVQAPNEARAWQLLKDYPMEKLDSLYRKLNEKIQKSFVKGNSIVCWSDTLAHDTDPVTDVVLRLQKGQNVSINDLLCNDNVLLIFSQLKQQYLAGQNTEFNAISIYTLCKEARKNGLFFSCFSMGTSGDVSKEELKQFKSEVSALIEKAKNETDRKYFQMALRELEKIE